MLLRQLTTVFIDATGDLFLLVFSVDSRESFDEVARLRTQIIETKCHIGGGRQPSQQPSVRGGKKTNVPSHVPMVIAGNKCDREMRYSRHIHGMQSWSYWVSRNPIRTCGNLGDSSNKLFYRLDASIYRTVTTEESTSLYSGFADCGFVETSAKKNWNIDELFRQLFQLADLPPEMAPNSHRRLLPSQVMYMGHKVGQRAVSIDTDSFPQAIDRFLFQNGVLNPPRNRTLM